MKSRYINFATGYAITAIFIFMAQVQQLYADAKSTTGTLNFDVNGDNQPEASLSQLGFRIGNGSPSANLHVTGNALVTKSMVIGGASNSSGSNLHIHGTLGYRVQSYGAGSNTIANTSIVLADTSADNVVLQLPDASSSDGQQIIIKRISHLNTLYISGAGNTMDAYTTLVFGAGNLNSITLMSSNHQWYFLDRNHSDNLIEVGSSNMLLWWKLNETSGNTLVDFSGLGHSGIASNHHQFSGNSTTGALGTAIRLDDFDDTLSTTSAGIPSSVYSYSFWIKSSHGAGNSTDYFSDPDGVDPEGVAGFIWASSNALFHKSAYHKLSSGEYVTTPIASSLSANTWYHIGTSWNGNQLDVYLNGTRESGNGLAATWAGGSNILLSHPGTFPNGTVIMDDLRIYNKSLNVSDFKALNLSGKP